MQERKGTHAKSIHPIAKGASERITKMYKGKKVLIPSSAFLEMLKFTKSQNASKLNL